MPAATLTTLLWLLLGHFVADYALQSDFMAKAKNRNRKLDPATIPPGQTPQAVWPWVLTAHASVHAAAVGLVTGSPLLALGELVVHWAIDYGKCENLYGIHQDQALHLATKVVWVALIILTAGTL